MEEKILPDRCVRFLVEVSRMLSFKVVMAYLIIVMISPVWRMMTKPLALKKLMIVHNVLCVLLSAMSLASLCYGIYQSGSLFHMLANPHIKDGLFIYLCSKYLELLDTLFMILRHKQRQISFLHVYHHSSILLLGDYSHRFAPWPPVAAMIGLNSMVHVFLYAYYAKSAISSGVDQIWKKRLTQLQIFQFVLGLMLCTHGYMHHGFCVYGLFYGLSMLFLFSNFYYWAYVARKVIEKKKD